ncbi:uncharacterized protein LOC126175826 [Schistocerca cancellata]|uniref:uncharacterized protein LOC126175826 n=1 Tax=Schistocerca cancellata TaxID=274614 RepID=UPI00211954F9|nr:uncharacterized protein LOC126175826 [Schistocerca cancellata]
MRAVACLLILCLTYHTDAQRNAGCSVDVWRVKSRHEPVLAVGGALALPDRETGQLLLPKDGVVLAGCPGAGNSLKLDKGLPHVNASCTSTGSLQAPGGRVTAGNLWCENRPLAEAHKTARRCGPSGKLRVFELGFNVSRQWLPVIEACHDADKASTFYSHHQLLGSLLRFRRQQTQPRPTFTQGCESGELFLGVSPSNAYSPSAVQQTLSTTLGSEEKARQLLAQTTLSRGHLAPSADFILNTQQHASFFYVNTAPQWQIFNEGNWLSVESVLRNHAQQQLLDLEVWTGTHGVLTLNDTEGRQKELYLAEGERMAVPLFFWKLVHDPKSGTAIAFVGVNNPFAAGTAAEAQLCPDVCGDAGWARRKWNRPNKGRVTCCSAQELAAAVPGAPQVHASGLLAGPRA